MTETEKAKLERVLGIAWFDGNYDEAGAKLAAEQQSLDWIMVKYWYGREYAISESIGSQVAT